MKFTATTLLFTLGAFVASCSAACSCSASDQPCMDKCVMAANACIVKCESTGGDICQQACISSNWPSVPVVQKQVLADATTSASMTKETGNPSTMMTASMSMSSMMSSGSMMASASKSGMNPSMSSRPTTSLKVGDNTNTSGASRQQILSAVGMVTVMASFVTYFF